MGQLSWTNYNYQATLNISSGLGEASITAREQDNNDLYFFGYNIARWENG